MDNQHRKISGYRELSQAEVDLMNEVKALGPRIEEVLEKVRAHVLEQHRAASLAGNAEEASRLHHAAALDWTVRAKTDLQVGLMALTRAVAQPTFF